MANYREMSVRDQLFMRAYRYRQARWSPAPVRPLHESRAAIVTTAGLHLPEQEPFDEGFRGGDYSYRWIPSGVDVQALRVSHRSHSFSREGILADRNLCFPLDRVRELVEEGILGSVNERHASFMGSITAPGRLVSQTAPEVARELRRDEVDVALLVPV